ncbi:exonuclease SbcCD subunit D [Ferrimicrobium sp.]|uniref:metallophosphoesterase family protein n=1 Tax=Ferrimicrobium sp. TaxID=2926050 RepID=UPI003450C3F5
MVPRILHTSDLQLGMTRRFFDVQAQARYTDDQFGALRSLASIANQANCDAVVIAGDVFDAVQPRRSVVSRAVEALNEFQVPVFLLPGNHDPNSPEAIWTSWDLPSRLSSQVTVLRDSTVHSLANGQLEIVGAPWTSRRPDRDLVAETLAGLEPPPQGTVRLLVGHGGVDAINPDPTNQNLIRLDQVEDAIERGIIHYLALGDRHSSLEIGRTGRVWYSGAPLMTDFREDVDSTNCALLVDVDVAAIDIASVKVGQWCFLREEIEMSGMDLLDAIRARLTFQGDRSRTALRFVITGTLNVAEQAELDEMLDQANDTFASVRLSEDHCNIALIVDEADLAKLVIGGYGDAVVTELAGLATGTPPNEDAVLALRTLYRLVGGSE